MEAAKPTTSSASKRRHVQQISDRIMSIIGDEDTCVGFIMGGIGDININQQRNFMVVKADTEHGDIEDCFKQFIKREDIAVILINQNIADMIRSVVDAYNKPIPAVLEIPSRDHPYNPEKDSILKLARKIINPEN
jgi:V-type H+-transporting ATPase subunit F